MNDYELIVLTMFHYTVKDARHGCEKAKKTLRNMQYLENVYYWCDEFFLKGGITSPRHLRKSLKYVNYDKLVDYIQEMLGGYGIRPESKSKPGRKLGESQREEIKEFWMQKREEGLSWPKIVNEIYKEFKVVYNVTYLSRAYALAQKGGRLNG